MGYTLSKNTARKVMRLVNRVDQTPVRVGMKPDAGADPNGVDVPFRLVVRRRPDPTNEDATICSLWIYLPYELISDSYCSPVWRNGMPIPCSWSDTTREGNWTKLYEWTAGSLTDSILLYIDVQGSGSAPEWAANDISNSTWALGVSPATNFQGHVGPDCRIIFGRVDQQTDEAINSSHGPFILDWIMTDEEASAENTGAVPQWPVSISRDDPGRGTGPYGATGLYRFFSPTPLSVGTTVGEWPSGMEDDTVIVRHNSGSRFEVAYVPIGAFAKGDGSGDLGPDIQRILDAYHELTAIGCPADGLGDAAIWDPCAQEFTSLRTIIQRLKQWLAGFYWEQGGDETTCYGSGIGDPAKNRVINLQNRTLENAWNVDALNIANQNITINGDTYRPTPITIDGVQWTVLAKV